MCAAVSTFQPVDKAALVAAIQACCDASACGDDSNECLACTEIASEQQLRTKAHLTNMSLPLPAGRGLPDFGLGHQPDQGHEPFVHGESCVQPGHFALGHLSGMHVGRQLCNGGPGTRRKSRVSGPLLPLVPRCVTQQAGSTTHARLVCGPCKQVKQMKHMFQLATAFNAAIGRWDVGRVTDMVSAPPFALCALGSP